MVVPDADELAAGDPIEVARENAGRKLRAAAERLEAQGTEPPAAILATDTVVVLDGGVH